MLTGEASDADDEGGEVRASSGTSLPTSSATSMLDEIKKRQGAGFKLAFYPGNSTVYDPLRSKTFKVVPKQMFLLQYADNSALKGFQSRDIVRLGDYSVEAKFGSITDCNSPDFNGVDGIMGFGMPVKTPPPASHTSDTSASEGFSVVGSDVSGWGDDAAAGLDDESSTLVTVAVETEEAADEKKGAAPAEAADDDWGDWE